MASFIGCVDYEPLARREPPAKSIEELAIVDGLTAGRARSAHVEIDWRAAPTAPIDQARSDRGGWCIVIGHVEPDEEGPGSAAAYLLEQAEKDPASIASFGGYYFAIVEREDGSVCLGADHLGLFPVYHWIDGERLHFATSPPPLRHLRNFQSELDPRGVVTLLLTSHGSRGHTLWRGVRRLDAGAAIFAKPGVRPHEIQSSPVAVGDDLLDSGRVDELIERSLHALRPVYPVGDGGEVAILLSGGLDSRILAGLLERDRYAIVAAVTLGRAGEGDFDCAKRVARALTLQQIGVPSGPVGYLEDALRVIRAEGLGSDWLAFDFDQARPALRELGVPIVTGFSGDTILGGQHIKWARDARTGEFTFDAYFQRMNNRYGFPPEIVRELLRPEFRGDCVEEEVEDLRRVYEDLPGLDYQKPWQFDLMYRQRLVINAINWRLSFGSWPVPPYSQKGVHRLAARLPYELFERRFLQRMILERRFPELARVPVDKGGYRMDPLVSGALGGVTSRLRAWRYRRQKVRTGLDPRYYKRVFDFDGEGFRAIRRRAAPILDVLDDVFEPDALRRILPGPEMSGGDAKFNTGSAGFKSILGIALLRHELGLP